MGTDNQQAKERQIQALTALQTLKEQEKGKGQKAADEVENARQTLTTNLPTDLVDDHTKFVNLLNETLANGGADAGLAVTNNNDTDKTL